MGHVGSITRSLDQILEKPCVHCRGHSFSPIIMKVCQNVFFDKNMLLRQHFQSDNHKSLSECLS